jgi:hypothetical protein
MPEFFFLFENGRVICRETKKRFFVELLEFRVVMSIAIDLLLVNIKVNKTWTFQRNWQQRIHKMKTKKKQTKKTTMCWTPLNTQTNTNNVNLN